MQCEPFALSSPVDCNNSSKLVASKMAHPTVTKAATAAKAATAKAATAKAATATKMHYARSSVKQSVGKNNCEN